MSADEFRRRRRMLRARNAVAKGVCPPSYPQSFPHDRANAHHRAVRHRTPAHPPDGDKMGASRSSFDGQRGFLTVRPARVPSSVPKSARQPASSDRRCCPGAAAARKRIAELEAREAQQQRAVTVQAALYRIAETASSAEDMQAFYARFTRSSASWCTPITSISRCTTQSARRSTSPTSATPSTRISPTRMPGIRSAGRCSRVHGLRAAPREARALHPGISTAPTAGRNRIVASRDVEWMGVPLRRTTSHRRPRDADLPRDRLFRPKTVDLLRSSRSTSARR